MGRTWDSLSKDEQKIVAFMKSEGISADELAKRLRKSGKLKEEQIRLIKTALEEIDEL